MQLRACAPVVQEDLEESDRYQRTLEDQLDHKTNELIVLR